MASLKLLLSVFVFMSAVFATVPAPVQKSFDRSCSQKTSEPSVTVSKMAPISVERDWLDYATFACAVALLAVGGIGTFLANRSLRAIKRQADLMNRNNAIAISAVNSAKESAHAALTQTQAMIDKERARIFVKASAAGLAVNVRQPSIIGGFSFELLNVGPTPAINVSVEYLALATVFESETNPETNNRTAVPEVIAANQSVAANFAINSAVTLPPPARIYIHLFGVVRYNDVISQDERSTRFRFRMEMKSRGDGANFTQSKSWEKFGSSADNYAT